MSTKLDRNPGWAREMLDALKSDPVRSAYLTRPNHFTTALRRSIGNENGPSDGLMNEATTTQPPTFNTREAWLREAVVVMRSYFEGSGVAVTDRLEVMTSWPYGSKKRIGECFPGEHWNKDGVTYVTVSPVLGDDPVRVLDVLLHELVHACGIHGHGKEFRRVAEYVGLTGKMTATVPTDALRERLTELSRVLGPYPHVTMVPQPKKLKVKSKVSWRRYRSPVDETFVVVIPSTTIDVHGVPSCPICGDPLVLARK